MVSQIEEDKQFQNARGENGMDQVSYRQHGSGNSIRAKWEVEGSQRCLVHVGLEGGRQELHQNSNDHHYH